MTTLLFVSVPTATKARPRPSNIPLPSPCRLHTIPSPPLHPKILLLDLANFHHFPIFLLLRTLPHSQTTLPLPHSSLPFTASHLLHPLHHHLSGLPMPMALSPSPALHLHSPPPPFLFNRSIAQRNGVHSELSCRVPTGLWTCTEPLDIRVSNTCKVKFEAAKLKSRPRLTRTRCSDSKPFSVRTALSPRHQGLRSRRPPQHRLSRTRWCGMRI